MSISPKNIVDFLRLADKEIKNSNLESAMGYINKIFELEQKNVYAKAYKERIISLMEGQGLSRADAEQKAASSKLAEPAVPALIVEQKQEPSQNEQQKPEPAKLQTVEVKKPDPVIEQPKIIPPTTAQIKYVQIRRSAAASDAYRALLMEIWKDGMISPDEQSRIDSMRETFAITGEEHAVIEKDVRLTCYLHSIRDEWRKGITNFAPQRNKFLVTDQEQVALEPKVFQLLQSLQSNGSVLVLDDETTFLRIIKDVLNDSGYYCFTSTTGEEGLQLLETMTPDIVVCDINFSKPNMSGFAFYEKFRSIDKFLMIPFIFLSGLDQDVLVRTGKKLGADDYLFKPIDAEMFLATIEGKLRRSRELKRIL